MFLKNKKLLLFIGAPRTGSTFLGQVINYHPQCLVATEYRLLNKVIIERKKINNELKKLKKVALNQFKTDLTNDQKFGKTLNIYQKKWIAMDDLNNDPDFKKSNIKVIGDKKAGGNTKVFIDYPNEFNDFVRKNKNIYFLQIIRNPIDAANSLMKSHNIKSFNEACEDIIMKTSIANTIGMKFGEYYFLYYENLLNNSIMELKNILCWLELDFSQNWLKKISEKINKTEKKEYKKEQFDIAYSIVKKYKASSILNKYF